MTNVTLALVVAFLAVLACGGGSVRASLDAPSPDGPTIVGEGQDCQETVSPEFQTICAPGLDCVPVNPGLAGSPGTCQPETAQSPSGPTFVGEDEDCNGTVSPEFQTLCGPGLTCVVDPDAGFGASGTCKPAQPTVVGEGDECNGSLPPEFATICAEGLTCVTSGVPGASGTCQAEASFGIPFDCRVDFFSASKPELSILNALFVFDSNNFIDLYDPPSDPEGLVYTAFLPNNDAFEALFATANITLDELLAGEVTINENVNNLLFYHVVPDVQVFAADLATDQVLETATDVTPWGTNDTILIENGDIIPVNTYKDINVVEADITEDACQFVFHILDAVLIPNGVREDAPEPEPEPEGPTIVGEGEVCNGSLPPQFATICAEGLTCVRDNPNLLGSPGICTAD